MVHVDIHIKAWIEAFFSQPLRERKQSIIHPIWVCIVVCHYMPPALRFTGIDEFLGGLFDWNLNYNN